MSADDDPLITTIIPTYRRPELLRRAVSSALAQAGPAVRVAVFDNASGDATADVVAELAANDRRVTYHAHPENIGALANFQFGLARVNTPYFSFLSDDDVLLPGFYESAVTQLEACPEAAFWCGVTVSLRPDGSFVSARVADWPRDGVFLPPEGLLQMLRGSMPCWTSALFRKSVMDDVGPLNETLQGPSDIEYMLRTAASHPFVISKAAAAIFLLNPASFSETAPLQEFWPGWREMMRVTSEAGAFDDTDRRAIRSGIRANARRMLFRRGAAALAKGGYEFSREASAIILGEFEDRSRGALLGGLTQICSRWRWAQQLYSYTYNQAERAIVRRRVEQRAAYGRFSKHL